MIQRQILGNLSCLLCYMPWDSTLQSTRTQFLDPLYNCTFIAWPSVYWIKQTHPRELKWPLYGEWMSWNYALFLFTFGSERRSSVELIVNCSFWWNRSSILLITVTPSMLFIITMTATLSKNAVSAYQIFHANYFLLPWKIPEEISRRSMLLLFYNY